MGPNDRAARWFYDHRADPGLFPTDTQALPWPGGVEG